jgi:hypothetical protein
MASDARQTARWIFPHGRGCSLKAVEQTGKEGHGYPLAELSPFAWLRRGRLLYMISFSTHLTNLHALRPPLPLRIPLPQANQAIFWCWTQSKADSPPYTMLRYALSPLGDCRNVRAIQEHWDLSLI